MEDFENYNLEDEEEDKQGAAEPSVTLWRLLPQIMITPSSGWERAKNVGPPPELAVVRFLLPLALISGAAVFLSLFYPHYALSMGGESVFAVLLVSGVIQFCSFFIGYFLALVLAKVLLPKNAKFLISSPFGKLITLVGVATLALFHILYVALPMFDFFLDFLPLWTIFIIYSGLQKVALPSDKSILTVVVMCLVVIGTPTVIAWFLTLFT